MNCEQIQNMLLLADTNEISQEQRAELEKHLAQCPACLALQRETEKIIEISRSALYTGEPNPATITSILRAGNNYVGKPAVFNLWRPSAILLPAAAVLIAVIALFASIYPGNKVKDVKTHRIAYLNDLMAIISPTIEDFTDEYSNGEKSADIRMVAHRLLIFQGFAGNDMTSDAFDMIENSSENGANDS
jgi:hypothetical protein